MSQVIELSTRGQTIPAALHRAARLNAELPFLSYMTKEKGEGKAERMKRVTLTFREFERRVNRVARFLYALNLPHGTAALVLSGNCPEWLVAEFAIFQAGMVLVPPYPTLKAEEVQYQIQHAGVKVAFVENQEQLNKLGDLDDPTLVRVVAFSEVTPHPKVALMGAISNDVLVSPEPLASSTLIDPSAKAVQIYTSGSSGVPKGVEHSHESLLANVDLLLRIPIFHAGQPISAILFFAHIYPLVTTVMAAVAGLHMILPGGVSRRARINPRAMMDALKFGDVELAVLVPQLLAKIKTGIEEKARSQGSTFLESKKNELSPSLWRCR
jgi:long-subunit acyl-CoA synthetase (AMP-forming)